MILSKEDTIYASKIVVDYFSKFERIDDYFRARKIERVKALPPPLFGMSVEDDMFQSWDMHPEEMNFSSMMGFLAIILASVNIFGGFVVSHRMLSMFKKKDKKKNND